MKYARARKDELIMVIDNFIEELELRRRLDTWLNSAKRDGYFLDTFDKNVARSDKHIADTLKYCLNFLGIRMTPERIFELNNEKFIRFFPHRSGGGFLSDIEKESQFCQERFSTGC